MFSAALVFLINVLPLLLSSVLMMPGPNPNPFPAGNTLVVTAHPDDEVMFFSTAIQALTREPKGDVWALCLSNGNADGLGSQRAGELAKAYKVFGVPQDHIILFGHPELQDSITAEWNPDVVSSTIKQIVGTHDIQNLITFDESGVSLHPNHAAIAKALPSLSDTALSIFSLQTHAPPTKFVSFLSVLPPFTMLPQLHAAGEHIKVRTNYRGWWNAVKAMREHESQMEWYRWLYLAASRYLWVGEYVQVK